jgi:hypothetical protein
MHKKTVHYWIPSEGPAEDPLRELKCFELAINGLMLIPGGATEEERRREPGLLREAPEILRRLVARWKASGPNLKIFLRDSPLDAQAIFRICKDYPVAFIPTRSGGGRFVRTFLDGLALTPRLEAFRWFCLLITNPHWDRFAGPCERCGKYYVRHSLRKRVYCSRSCGSRMTALEMTAKARQVSHALKVKRVQAAAEAWKTAKTGLDWKTWVCGSDEGFTLTFLTRCINRGELIAPLRERVMHP